MLCFLRLVMFLVFVLGLTSRGSQQGNSEAYNAKESHYFKVVGLAGTLYLLSLPGVVAFTNYALDNLSQQSFIVFGSFACQMFAICTLFFQFTVKHSAYYEISYKASTFLPGKDQ